MTTINAQTIINAVMQAHACAPEEGSDLISFAISAKGVQKVKNCKANLLRFAELVRKNARAFGGGIARTIKPRAAVIWPAQAVRLVYELLQDEQYQDAAALAEEQCGAVFYEGHNHKTKSPQAIMMWAPQAVAGLPECLRSARVDSGRYCVYDIASGMTVMGHHKTRANAEASAVTTWQGVSEEKRAEALAKAKPSNPATARAQWLAEHGIISEEATAERAKRRAARDAERAAQDVAQVVAQAVAAAAISEAMQPVKKLTLREHAVNAFLDSKSRTYGNSGLGVGTVRELMTRAVEMRLLITSVMVRDEASRNRDIEKRSQGSNLPTGNECYPGVKEYLTLCARITADTYEKPEYRMHCGSSKWDSFYCIAKTAFDFAKSLEAMQPSEAADSRELVTCEAGDNEANAPSMGSASTGPAWQPEPQYVPPVSGSTGFGQSMPPAYRGADLPEGGEDTPAPAATPGVEGVARPNLDAAPISKKTTFGTLKNGDAFCFLSGENEMVYVRCKGGYRPGRGGDCMRLRREYVVYLYDLTPPAVESTDAPMAPAVETVQDAPVVAAPIAAPVAQRYTFKPGVQDQKIVSKSGKWMAATRMTSDGLFELGFKIGSGCSWSTTYPTASDRMKALQSMARAADAPTDTPPTGGLPCPDSQASNATEKTEGYGGSPVQNSNDALIHPRNIIPANGLHIVDEAFEAWTFTQKTRFCLVIYLGKSAKPWKYYGYPTAEKRDEGFNRLAIEARGIFEAKTARKSASKAQADKPHGLIVGDVVRSSWGYEQTNINHYQITAVIGKRTVEVRELAEHEESTGDMSGRVAPVHGEFVGDAKRCTVDKWGQVNVRGKDYGRASKIEPLAIIHGVRCYAASHYSDYA